MSKIILVVVLLLFACSPCFANAIAVTTYSFSTELAPDAQILLPYGVFNLGGKLSGYSLAVEPVVGAGEMNAPASSGTWEFLVLPPSQQKTYIIDGKAVTAQVEDTGSFQGGYIAIFKGSDFSQLRDDAVYSATLDAGGSWNNFWSNCTLSPTINECNHILDFAFQDGLTVTHNGAKDFTRSGSIALSVTPTLDSKDDLLGWKENISIQPAPSVPESPTTFLFVIGAMSLFAVARRKRKKSYYGV